MSLRNCCGLLLAIVLSSQFGCCSVKCWPFGKTYCGSQCGDFIWNEWFSLPPDCCDPCNNCGAFLSPNNRYLRRGVTSVRDVYDIANGNDHFVVDGYGGYGGYGDDSMYGNPGPAGPEPVQSSPPRRPTPAEELPGVEGPGPVDDMPFNEPSAGVTYNEFGQIISYNAPVDSPEASRTLGRPQSRLLNR